MRCDWEVLLILDPAIDAAKLYSPSTYMPVWIVDSAPNRQSVADLRTRAEDSQLADFTTFKDFYLERYPVDLSSLLEVIDLHHAYMTRLNVMGAEKFPGLTTNLKHSGYVPARESWPEAIAFKRKLPAAIDVPSLELQATSWETPDDVFDSLFAAIGAPAWHGRNFNALNDSIVTGDINFIEVPYRLTIHDLNRASPPAQAFSKDFRRI